MEMEMGQATRKLIQSWEEELAQETVHMPFTYACDMRVLLHKSQFCTVSQYYRQTAECA